jgi:hypothetical protein
MSQSRVWPNVKVADNMCYTYIYMSYMVISVSGLKDHGCYVCSSKMWM